MPLRRGFQHVLRNIGVLVSDCPPPCMWSAQEPRSGARARHGGGGAAARCLSARPPGAARNGPQPAAAASATACFSIDPRPTAPPRMLLMMS
jgi:hypothetical protein